MRPYILLGAILLASPRYLLGKEPALTHIHPAGIQQGTEADVKLTGKFDPWPCKVWADDPGIIFTPDKDTAKFHVTVTSGVRRGPHLIRAFNAEGASSPISMVAVKSPAPNIR